MGNSNDIRRGRHYVFNLHVHLVFVAKYRKNIFTKAMIQTMKGLFEKICADFETGLVEIDGERDHVHLMLSYPPKVSVAKLVNSLKGVSSRRLKQLHPELESTIGKGLCGVRAILQGRVVAHPLISFDTTSNNKTHRTNVL